MTGVFCFACFVFFGQCCVLVGCFFFPSLLPVSLQELRILNVLSWPSEKLGAHSVVVWIKMSMIRRRPELIFFQCKQLAASITGALANKRKD